MSKKNLLYILSLFLIAFSFFLILNYPESGRMNMIAGATICIGFCLNIAAFLSGAKTAK